MKIGCHHSQTRRWAAFAASSSIAVLGAASAFAAQVTTVATADAELRETQPERTRGFGAATNSGQQAELQISSGVIATGNRNIAVMRFNVPASVATAADLENYADISMQFRAGFNSGATSLRLYGLSQTHPLNTSWNEQEVMYRDTGSYLTPNPLIGTGQAELSPNVFAQPAPGNVAAVDPVAPVGATAGYGADANHARRAPGVRYEDAPFSSQTATENSARLTYNQNQRTGYLADLADNGVIDGVWAYLTYFNQPGYGVTTAATLSGTSAISVGDGNPATPGDGIANIWSDVPESNRPFFSGATDSWVDDLEASTTYLGFTTMPSGARTAGQAFYFTSDLGAEDTAAAQLEANRQALVAFLAAGITGGMRDFTFLVGPGIGQGGDILNPTNLQIASKDFIPTGGLAGDFGPRLIMAPEPGTISALLGLTAVALRRRRAK